jgi:hypothetical protein
MLAAVAALGAVSPARAEVSPLTVIDGPSPDVVDFGGVAMAPDGTGGVVYRKRVGGRIHIFAAQTVDGAWRPAQQVDVGQAFDSSWPAIGAGNGGRLVVVWVQEFGTGSDRMFSASLDPGARRFQAPIPIDLKVGEATATFPSLAMNAGGAAYLAYRVLPSLTADPNLPPGYIDADTRLQRYDGSFWSALGQNPDRNPSVPVRAPTAANTAKVAIDQQGNGAVVWQEPDDDFVDRIWARRIFGQVLGIPLLVSPQKWGDKPLRGPADQFAVDIAGFGEIGVAFRQQPGDGTALKGTRVMVNTSPEAFSDNAKTFAAARVADGAGDPGPAQSPGPASIGIANTGAFLAAFGLGTTTLGIEGGDAKVGDLQRLDDGASTIAADPLADLATDGAAVLAWKARVGGRSSVVVRERGSDGVSDSRPLSTPQAGPVSALGLSGSGFGDGIAAFIQGNQNAGAIAAAVVDAPPSAFVVQTPIDWVKDPRIPITWDPAVNAIGRVAYSLTVDDQVVAEGLRSTRLTLGPDQLDDGVHSVAVIATDPGGQETTSTAGDLQVDRTAPAVTVTTKGRKATVRVSDGPAKETSGLVTKRTLISFGAGGKPVKGKPKATFRYPRAGSFVITVKARDVVGNGGRTKRRVTVK